jgi:hypothetical protein
MPALSGFFDPRGARRALQGVPPRLQFDGRGGSFSHVVGVRDALSGRFIAKHTPVAFGTRVVLDFGSAERGWLSFKPFDDSKLVPMHQPVDVENPPGEDYTLVLRLPCWLEGLGLAQFTCPGVILQNAVFNLFVQYRRAGEASAGKIPVVALRPSQQIPIASRNGELHPAPQFEIVGWVTRDPDRYGARTVPLPTAQVAADDAMPALPGAAPGNDNGAAPAAPASLPANDDAFADMVPVAGTNLPPF